MRDADDTPPNAEALSLARQISTLDVQDGIHRRDMLIERIKPAIWAWARSEPLDVRLLGEHLAAIANPAFDDLIRLAGFCMLAAAHHHSGGERPPFLAIAHRGRSAPYCLRISDAAPGPWASRKHETLASIAFGDIARGLFSGVDELGPSSWSADETLSLLDQAFASGESCCSTPRLHPEQWPLVAEAIDRAGLRSSVESATAPSTNSRPTPTL